MTELVLAVPRPRAAVSSWRAAQAIAWGAGVGLVVLLLAAPEAGLAVLWNGVVPVLPALIVFAPGVWRNVCPMATTSLLPIRFGASARRRLAAAWQGRLMLAAVALLFLVIPLRRVALDTSGVGSAMMLVAAAGVAVVLGAIFDWKSAWCAGLCPVGQIERLYGAAPAKLVRNAQCDECSRCVVRCLDTSADPMRTAWPRGSVCGRLAGGILAGAFPGFICGWFMVPDYSGGEGWSHLGLAYGVPWLGGAVTLAVFALVCAVVRPERRPWVTRVFAALAVACYYWFRLPALIGFGVYPGDGMLFDLRGAVGVWLPATLQLTAAAILAWWLLWPARLRQPWSIRPERDK